MVEDLGLAFDDQRTTIDGTPFIKYLQDRLHKPQTKALLGAVAQRFPAAVVMLDLGQRDARRSYDGRRFHRPGQSAPNGAWHSRNIKVAAERIDLVFSGRTPSCMNG